MEFDVWTIVSAVLGLVAVVAGGFWLKAKGKIKAAADLFKEAYEVVAKVYEVLQDDKVSKEEVAELKKEVSDVSAAFKALIGK
jgi:divalent metal cation (Fe/Co/Zn/Cd) transporter